MFQEAVDIWLRDQIPESRPSAQLFFGPLVVILLRESAIFLAKAELIRRDTQANLHIDDQTSPKSMILIQFA